MANLIGTEGNDSLVGRGDVESAGWISLVSSFWTNTIHYSII